MNDKLIVIKEYKLFIERYYNIIINLDNRNKDIKTRVINNMFNILNDIYYTNLHSINKRKVYQMRIISNIKSLDYYCRESKKEEFIEASNTIISNWLEYIVNSFIDKRLSNGFTEGLNNKIKVIKIVGFGYKTFSFFRLRLLYILNSKKIKKNNSRKNKKIKN